MRKNPSYKYTTDLIAILKMGKQRSKIGSTIFMTNAVLIAMKFGSMTISVTTI